VNQAIYSTAGWLARLWRHCLSQTDDGKEFLQWFLVEVWTEAYSVYQFAEQSWEIPMSFTDDWVVTTTTRCSHR